MYFGLVIGIEIVTNILVSESYFCRHLSTVFCCYICIRGPLNSIFVVIISFVAFVFVIVIVVIVVVCG